MLESKTFATARRLNSSSSRARETRAFLDPLWSENLVCLADRDACPTSLGT